MPPISAAMGTRPPRIIRNSPNAAEKPISSKVVTSAVRPPNTISAPSDRKINGRRSSGTGQICGLRISART
jgi:hypothetical protein